MTPPDSLDAPPPSRHGRLRWLRVGQNAGALAGARLVSGLCQLALVPLLLGLLGPERFGWVMALLALVGLSQFGDLGVAMALQQKLSEAWAHGDHARLRQIHASGTCLLRWFGFGWLAVLAPLAWWTGDRLLAAPVVPAGVDSAPLCWMIIAFSIAVGIPLSTGPRLAAALQQGWLAAGWTAAANVLAVAVVWLIHRQGPAHAATLLTVLCLAQLVPGIVTTVHLRRRLGWRGNVAASATTQLELWRSGRHFAAPNVAGALLTAAAPAAVARFGGYEAAAAFAVLQRLFGLVQQAHAMVIAPLWPAWTEAIGRGEIAWVRRSLRLVLSLTAAACLSLAAMTMLLPRIVDLWLGPEALVPPYATAALVATWIGALMTGQSLSYFLLGAGRLERVAFAVAVSHVCTLAAMAYLGSRFGGTGVIAALAAGALLGSLVLFVRESLAAWRELLRAHPKAVIAMASL